MGLQHYGVSILLVPFITLLLLTNDSDQTSSSDQAQTLLDIQRILNYPSALTTWNHTTDFCNTYPSPDVIVICQQNSVIQLYIFGNVRGTSKPPPINNKDFSMELLVTTLATLPNLQSLVLSSLGLSGTLPAKISLLSAVTELNLNSNYLTDVLPQDLSSLRSLRSLSLDDNLFTGELPDSLFRSFPVLTSLSIKNNTFNGTLPNSIIHSETIKVLRISRNRFHGEVPDFSGLTNLEVVDLDHNNFEGEFPYYLLAMPGITHLEVSSNKLTGELKEDQKCSGGVEFVDLSFNFLTGHLPKCLAVKNDSRTVLFAWNCLVGDEGTQQHPISYCNNQTSIAAGRLNPLLVTMVALWIVSGIVIGV